MNTNGWLNPEDYIFNKELEKNYEIICEEGLNLIQQGLFKDHTQSKESSVQTTKIANMWKVFDLLRLDYHADETLAPVTFSIVKKHKDIYDRYQRCVYFSLVPSGGIVTPHVRGATIHFRARHQLCLKAPKHQNIENVHIDVGGEKRSWTEGKVLSFDDSYLHSVKNLSAENRLVLLYDSNLPTTQG
jgi:beta-hydroxylase